MASILESLLVWCKLFFDPNHIIGLFVILVHAISIIVVMTYVVIVMSSHTARTGFSKRMVGLLVFALWALVGRCCYYVGNIEGELTVFPPRQAFDHKLLKIEFSATSFASLFVMELGPHMFEVVSMITGVFLLRCIMDRDQENHLRNRKNKLLFQWFEYVMIIIFFLLTIITSSTRIFLLFSLRRLTDVLHIFVCGLCLGGAIVCIKRGKSNNPNRFNGVCVTLLAAPIPMFVINALTSIIFIGAIILSGASLWVECGTIILHLTSLVLPLEVIFVVLVLLVDLGMSLNLSRTSRLIRRKSRPSADEYTSLVS
ncbi:hypothetical protein J8273_8306 [Carpediemonas membranifera]|uniref:Uncharacterized protein n=1 Tax=Carpediemonas membranifera TaxID=201153 RepID=A0A8J6DZD6_9EUKA|nr:hypothetical protein J8273_8306 [Carpediemonas membranifera]|eukprot:KAG9390266.1 hypothetical protein J8273_8306 [Carpediemonas membranifera]